MAGKAMIPFLVGMMLLTGVCNTLLTKYQDMQCVRNCSSSDPSRRHNFEQPVWQTAQMFVGEMACWLVVAAGALYTRLSSSSSSSRGAYAPLSTDHHHTPSAADAVAAPTYTDEEAPLQPGTAPALKPTAPTDASRRPLHGRRILLLALPAMCDIAGTTLMNVGLLFVAASIYQMTRGALVLFVGLASVWFLGRRLPPAKWAALGVVTAGVAIVGLAGAIEQRDTPIPGDGSPSTTTTASATPVGQTLVGVLLIALAQVFTAGQFVLEESIMVRYSTAPLAVVGWEGTFGLAATLLLQAVLHASYGRTAAGRGGYFDASAGWAEMTGHPAVLYSSLLIMVSIGGFNYFGLSVTRSVSATSRSTIDTCRTLFIWVVSLGLGWESFKWLQVLGFAALVYGTFLFNDIVRPPAVRFWRRAGAGEELLPERPVEHT